MTWPCPCNEQTARDAARRWSKQHAHADGWELSPQCVVNVGGRYEVLRTISLERFPILATCVVAAYEDGQEIPWPRNRT